MGLDDPREKLRQAEEWLATEPRGSAKYGAAWDHLRWVLTKTADSSLRTYAQKIADDVISR